MFKRLLATAALILSSFSAQAGIVTIYDALLDWNIGTTPENGGSATVYYRESDNRLKSFQVNVAPFADSLATIDHPTDDWLTPMDGSNITFEPVDLYSIIAEDVLYISSLGMSVASWRQTPMDGVMTFPYGLASWDIDIKSTVSPVPEPQSWILMLTGLAVMIRMKKKKTELPQALRCA